MRRVIAGLALILILGTGQGEARQAGATTRPLHLRMAVAGSANQEADAEWRSEQCRFRWLDGRRGWSDWEVRRTIWCAVSYWSVPGAEDGAVCIAENESGLNEWAANSHSSAAGVYQFIASTWDSVKGTFRMPWWKLSDGVYNGRANVIRAIRKAHAEWSWRAWEVRWLCGLG